MEKILTIAFQALAILFAIVIHESAHAWSADRFGDPTARLLGRITLNPIPHIDLLGTIIVPGAMILFSYISGSNLVFGWAKPVPVNPYNLGNPRKDQIWISAAGPGSNLLVAALAILIVRFMIPFHPGTTLAASFLFLRLFFLYLILYNIVLAVLNLIPIPPLDGSHILEGVLKGESLRMYQQIKPFGFFILIGIIYLGILDSILDPIIRWVFYLLQIRG